MYDDCYRYDHAACCCPRCQHYRYYERELLWRNKREVRR